MEQRAFLFLCYGLAAAWLIVIGYVLLLISREKKIRADLEAVRRLLAERETRR